MKKVFYSLSFLILSHFNSFSQTSVNDYKYIIVPTQYEFLKERDQYQINSITKFLFNKYGYTAYMQDEDLPEDLYNNKCLGLTADVIKDNAFLKTKLYIELKDCTGKVVHTSKVGETREKEYSKSYNLALRDAFETFQNLGYEYRPNAAIMAKGSSQTTLKASAEEQSEITRLKEEIKTLKEDKVELVEVQQPIVETKPLEATPKETMPTKEMAVKDESNDLKSNVLYAQSIDNGFQVVDSTPRVVMILYPTGAKDVFTVKDKNAIVFKKENQWIYSENNGKEVKETVVNIKF